MDLVRQARAGDSKAGQQAWHICNQLIASSDPVQRELGKALQWLMIHTEPEKALANLPQELAAQVQALLREEN